MDEIESKRLAAQHDLRVNYFRVFEETEGGKKVLADILRFCGIGDIPYVRGDTHQTAFNSGKMSAGFYINDMLDPEALGSSKAQVEAITDKNDTE